MPALWYAMRSKPRKEDFLCAQLRARQIECFYPRTSSGAARKMRPYFPGYLFIHADVEQLGLSALQWMPGAAGMVAFGGLPASVPEHLIHAIRRRVEALQAAGRDFLSGLRPGDPLLVREGPFAGYRAIFDARLSGDERVRVLLDLLDRGQVRVELPGGYVVAVGD